MISQFIMLCKMSNIFIKTMTHKLRDTQNQDKLSTSAENGIYTQKPPFLTVSFTNNLKVNYS